MARESFGLAEERRRAGTRGQVNRHASLRSDLLPITKAGSGIDLALAHCSLRTGSVEPAHGIANNYGYSAECCFEQVCTKPELFLYLRMNLFKRCNIFSMHKAKGVAWKSI